MRGGVIEGGNGIFYMLCHSEETGEEEVVLSKSHLVEILCVGREQSRPLVP